MHRGLLLGAGKIGHLTRRFEKLDSVRMRVGALPLFPTGALKYNLTWSTDGLINEYCNPCDLSGFLMRQVPAGRLWSARKPRCIRERSVRALRPHENRRAS